MKIKDIILKRPVCATSQTEIGCSMCGCGGFVEGTKILTLDGWREVDNLAKGDLVHTFQNGVQELSKVTQDLIWLNPIDCPTCVSPFLIPAGAVGNTTEFLIPSDTKIMMKCDAYMEHFGQPYVIMNTVDLLGFAGIKRITPPAMKTVFNLYLDDAEMVIIEGGAVVPCPKEKTYLEIFLDVTKPGQLEATNNIPHLTHEEADTVITIIEEELADMNRLGLQSLFNDADQW